MLDLFQLCLLLSISLTCITLICSAMKDKEKSLDSKKVIEPVKKVDEMSEKIKLRNEKIAIIRRRLKPKADVSSQGVGSCV